MVFRSITSILLLLSLSCCAQVDGQKILTVGGSVSTIRGKTSVEAPFVNSYYLSLDGSDECVTFASIIPVSASFTLNIWISPTSSLTTKGLFGVPSGATDYGRFANTTQFYIVLASSANTLTHGHTFTLDEWQMFTLTRDVTGILRVYRNAVEPSATRTSTNVTQIGQIGRVSSAANYLSGNIDEVAIWDRCLTSSEISFLYGGTTPQTCANPKLIPNLKLYYSFDNITSFPTVPDLGPVGNDGTCVNMESGDIKSY